MSDNHCYQTTNDNDESYGQNGNNLSLRHRDLAGTRQGRSTERTPQVRGTLPVRLRYLRNWYVSADLLINVRPVWIDCGKFVVKTKHPLHYLCTVLLYSVNAVGTSSHLHRLACKERREISGRGGLNHDYANIKKHLNIMRPIPTLGPVQGTYSNYLGLITTRSYWNWCMA